MSSCQITGISDETWRAFRRICLDEGISANRKLREIIEAEVTQRGTESQRPLTERTQDDERDQP
jgi:ribosomal protein S21